MSEENVEIIRRGWDAYTQGNLDALLEVFAPEAVTVIVHEGVTCPADGEGKKP